MTPFEKLEPRYRHYLTDYVKGKYGTCKLTGLTEEELTQLFKGAVIADNNGENFGFKWGDTCYLLSAL